MYKGQTKEKLFQIKAYFFLDNLICTKFLQNGEENALYFIFLGQISITFGANWGKFALYINQIWANSYHIWCKFSIISTPSSVAIWGEFSEQHQH